MPIEDLLERYASYREQVKRIDRWDENKMPVFPRHLEEFLQEQYGQSQRITNPLCTAAWNEFAAFCQQRIFDEDIAVADAKIFALTQQRAYQLWNSAVGRCGTTSATGTTPKGKSSRTLSW